MNGIDDKQLSVSDDIMKGVIAQYVGAQGREKKPIRKRKRKQNQDMVDSKEENVIKKKRQKKMNSNVLIVSPLGMAPLQENRMFYLYGGVILPIDFEMQTDGAVVSETRDYVKTCHRIASIETKENYVILNYLTQVRGLRNFQFLIDMYMNMGRLSYYLLAQALLKFQGNIIHWTASAEMHSSNRLQDPEDYMKDIQEFSKAALKQVNSLDQSSFYMYGIVAYNYSSNQLEQRSIGYSHSLLSLLGSDADCFIRMNLHCGQPLHFFGESIIEAVIAGLIPLSSQEEINNSKNFQKTTALTTLTTLDGFTVPCSEVRSYYFPKKATKIKPFEMALIIVEYEVSLSSLRQLLTLREAQHTNSDICTSFNLTNEVSFEYSMKSQIFMQKYYPNCFQEDLFRCKTRDINQKQPKLDFDKNFFKESLVVINQQVPNIQFNNVIFPGSSPEITQEILPLTNQTSQQNSIELVMEDGQCEYPDNYF